MTPRARVAAAVAALRSEAPTPEEAVREGLVAALALMVGSWGVGWLPMTPDSIFAGTTVLNPLRAATPGVVACALALALGSLAVVRAWLRLGRALAGRWEDALPVVRRAAWLWSAPLLLAFPVFSRDVFSYLQQGRLVALGMDPYVDGVSRLPGWFMHGADTIWAESPSPYGPLFLVVAEAVWRVSGGNIEAAVVAFRLLGVAGLALCLWAVPRTAARAGRDPAWAVWVSTLNPLFLFYMVAGAHNDALMLGLLMAGIMLLVSTPRGAGRGLAGLTLVALSVAIKPLTALVLPSVALLLPRGWTDPEAGRLPLRARLGPWATTAAVTLLVLTAVGAATRLWFGWVPAMLTSGKAAFPYAPVGLVGLGLGWAIDLVSPVPARDAAAAFYRVMTLAALGFTAWMALRRRPADPVVSAGAVLAVAVLTAPIIQPWYLVWVLPLLACARRPLPPVLARPGWLGWVTALAVLLLTGIGVVDQLAVPQWLPTAAIRVLTGAVSVVAIVWLVAGDPSTRVLFPRRRRPPDLVLEPCPAAASRRGASPPRHAHPTAPPAPVPAQERP